jgi:hypothetical protein
MTTNRGMFSGRGTVTTSTQILTIHMLRIVKVDGRILAHRWRHWFKVFDPADKPAVAYVRAISRKAINRG